MGQITEHVAEITRWAEEKGWHLPRACRVPGRKECDPGTDNARDVPPFALNPEVILMKLALVHSEVSEATEEVRDAQGSMIMRYVDEKPEGFVVELADVYIRIAHLCGMLGLDLEGAIEAKLAYNMNRPYRHGGKRA